MKTKGIKSILDSGRLSDDDNPLFLHSTTSTLLLAGIAQDILNPVEIAKRELRNRGLNYNGKWIGFNKPKKAYKI